MTATVTGTNGVNWPKKHDLIIVVPTFGRKDFPTTGSYNLGNIIDAKGQKTPKAKWSFSAIEPLFDDIVCRVSGNQLGYALYGHSAGGQFVHRFVAFADAPRMESAVAANSGWHTMPDDAAFPYGWGGDTAGLVSPEKAFQRQITILIGTEDTDRNGAGHCPFSGLSRIHRSIRHENNLFSRLAGRRPWYQRHTN